MALELHPDPVIDLKTVSPFDLGRVARLHKVCFDDAWSRSDLASLLALPGSFALLARWQRGGRFGLDPKPCVGFSICRVTKDECELLSLGVLPEGRQLGIGGQLIVASQDRSRTAAAASMFLEVAVDNLAAQKLYLNYGFEVIGRREAYYRRPDGGRVAALTMRAQLTF